ncbi:hypothetical protein TNIN_25891 [Trichonephila inaurata madagascariensis]|uniref:Uncharacterized protein n=1 Tax=Trichonephila inaurata madagascariensis TaxID=2747483 RepID=A0A8X7CFJ4_9ARAC|nr:hypothetical protein TNIN_25891 [Trichonephila inaurata madagascariensis]
MSVFGKYFVKYLKCTFVKYFVNGFGKRSGSFQNIAKDLLVKNSASGDVKNSEEMCCSRNANGGNHNREECSQTNAYVDSWKLRGLFDVLQRKTPYRNLDAPALGEND